MSYQSYSNNYNTGYNNQDYSTGGAGGFSTTNNYADNANGGFSDSFGGSQKSQLRTTLTPVTIKQINESNQPVPDGEFTINNVELNLVSFVGIVRNVVDNTSSLIITIEDGTGSIDVRKWVDEGKEQPEVQEINKYVHVTGALKEFNSKKNLQHATIRPIEDYNEVIYHHLSAIENHLAAQGVIESHGNNHNQESLFVPDNDNSSDLSTRIYNYVVQNNEEMPEGTSVKWIAQKMNILDTEVKALCTKMVEEGRLYVSYDDNTYAAV